MSTISVLSYEIALHKYEQRVAAGLQPSTPVVDLYSVDTEEALLVTANFLYLGLVILLYLRMLVRREERERKSPSLETHPFLIVYYKVDKRCIQVDGYCSYGRLD